MNLNTHSYYSLRYGTMSPGSLVKEAGEKGITALALTDINTSMGIPDFIKLCREKQIDPLAGIEFREKGRHLYTGIARNTEGLRELNAHLSQRNITGTPFSDEAPVFKQVHIIYPAGNLPKRKLKEHEWIGMQPADLRNLHWAKYVREKMIVFPAATFKDKQGYVLHRHLRAIDNNILLSRLQPEHLAGKDELLLSPQELENIYHSNPDLIQNTRKLIKDCSINLDTSSYKNKKTFTGSRYDDKLLLEKLSLDGLRYRYGANNREAYRRVRHELNIIDKLGFSSYFLITWDIIRYSMSRGFYHVGRGSGANSIVAYCLKITDVDPIALNLYFERFINPKRSSPPDFDIDYSWRERDEVLDYIFKRYGHDHTALLGATSTFKGKSIIRELGKVYGLPKNEIDALIRHPEDKKNQNEITEKIFLIGLMMTDFPNLRSIHAGGVLISEEPITCYTALDMPPKGFQTTQWDMYVAEDIGFEKLDILSQRGIGHIREATEIILENRKIKVDAHAIQDFTRDEAVKKMLRSGHTTGCFYIESPAMRGLLQKLHCDTYRDLVAASSIIRPGVARSGMMREYIRRFHNPNGFKYLHPVMKEQLHETFGVMVYQEDVLKVCHHFAGLDLADADVLRRAMSGKYRSKKEFERIVKKFFSNCAEKGYPEKLTREVWRQIESFAGYSFSKAHSASYAVESFQSLYLKTHFPIEFMTAVINNFGGFYHTWVYVTEARKYGAAIELPCINHSNYKTRVDKQNIYLGFIHIRGLEHKIGKCIPEERNHNGAFRGLADFISRVPVGIEQLLLLIRSGAFRFIGKSKKELLWNAHMLLHPEKEKTHTTRMLFAPPHVNYRLPPLIQSRIEDAYDEIELIGFPVTLSWFDLLKTRFRGDVPARELNKYVGRKVKMIGQLVTIKYIKTKNREWMHFGTFYDRESDFFDTVHFPQSLKKYPFRGSGMYLILGKVVSEFGFVSIEVEKLAKLPVVNDPGYG